MYIYSILVKIYSKHYEQRYIYIYTNLLEVEWNPLTRPSQRGMLSPCEKTKPDSASRLGYPRQKLPKRCRLERLRPKLVQWQCGAIDLVVHSKTWTVIRPTPESWGALH